MPIYEYRCHDCHRRISLLHRSFAEVPAQPVCPRCGGRRLVRLISRVSVMRSEDSRMEEMTDPSALGDLDEDDPKSIARWMRKMGTESGEEMPEEFGEVMDRLESGQSPEQIEEAMPELGEDMGSADDLE